VLIPEGTKLKIQVTLPPLAVKKSKTNQKGTINNNLSGKIQFNLDSSFWEMLQCHGQHCVLLPEGTNIKNPGNTASPCCEKIQKPMKKVQLTATL